MQTTVVMQKLLPPSRLVSQTLDYFVAYVDHWFFCLYG